MSEYSPDRWLLVKISSPTAPSYYRIFATWDSSYLYGSSWKLSSGCEGVPMLENDYWSISQSSGSTYRLRKHGEGITGLWEPILDNLKKQLKEIDGNLEIIEKPDFTKFVFS